jgi:hypothetical protein
VIYDATASNTQSPKNTLAWCAFIAAAKMRNRTHDGNASRRWQCACLSGLCYLVFDDLQLKDFANRIPNISAEVVADGDMQSDILIFPPATTMTKEGGILDQARGTMIGTGF